MYLHYNTICVVSPIQNVDSGALVNSTTDPQLDHSTVLLRKRNYWTQKSSEMPEHTLSGIELGTMNHARLQFGLGFSTRIVDLVWEEVEIGTYLAFIQ